MTLPIITSTDLQQALEDAFLRAYISSDTSSTRMLPIPPTFTKEDLRDIRRCCSVLPSVEVERALVEACRSVLAELAAEND